MEEKTEFEISPIELYQKLHEGQEVLLLDVRGENKYKDWHIFNSKNIPVMKLLETKSEDLNEFKNHEIVTICGLGNDSLIAAKKLQEKGIKAVSLKGGLVEWNSVFDFVDIPVNNDVKLTQVRRIAKGCLSYIISSKNEAIVIDPSFHIAPYIQFAEENDLAITKVFDTHLHADHVSGAKNLAESSNAELYLSPKDPYNIDKLDFIAIKHNNDYKINGTKITAIHTPGHTKGSMSFKIKGLIILTGDTVFTDSVGRPDLVNQSKDFASDLHDTIIKKIMSLNKEMVIAPAHHSKFNLSHFNSPIITKIANFSESVTIQREKQEFIEYTLDRIKALPHPPSYKEIRKINTGDFLASPERINEIEVGPNRCAMN